MLKFCNKYKTGVWVSIMYYEPGCSDGGDWVKKGWWRLTPGQCKVAYGGDLDDLNRYFCFYADADDGAVWAGPYKRFVPFQAFAWCEWIACSTSTATTTSPSISCHKRSKPASSAATWLAARASRT